MADPERDDDSVPILEGEYVESDAKPKRRRGRRFVWLLVVLLLAFIGGLAAAPYAMRQFEAWGVLPASLVRVTDNAGQQSAESGIRTDQRLDQFAARLGALERAVRQVSGESAAAAGRIESLARQIPLDGDGGGTMPPEALARIETRLTALTERISALESASAQAAGAVSPEEVTNLSQALQSASAERERLIARIETLTRRMATLEALSRAAPQQSPALMQSLLDLSVRIESGRPYGQALAAVRRQVGQKPEAARIGAEAAFVALAPHAVAGLPTRTALIRRFDPVAAAIQRAQPAPGEAGFFERLRRRLASIVVVRPKTAGGGDSLVDRLARSEAALEAGDLAAAVAALEELPAPVRREAEGWLADAKARLEAERALRALMAIAGAAPESAGGGEES